jgi:ElaB/YqjD/DUF883 family membrane-anchored ribosome-binding protein
MSFCGNKENTSLTDNELQATFGNGTNQQSILATNLSADSRDENGLLTSAAVKAQVGVLSNSGIVPVPPTASTTSDEAVATYLQKDKTMMANIRAEYCFYESRYKYSLQQLISKLQAGYNKNDTGNSQTIQRYLQTTQVLNQKLNDITQITAGIAELRRQSAKTNNKEIEQLSASMDAKAKQLQKQSEILSGQEGAANLYKDMMRYTKEKVRATDNLLSLYSFMNIFALGMLVYVYMSME